jgi:hypothetical protein
MGEPWIDIANRILAEPDKPERFSSDECQCLKCAGDCMPTASPVKRLLDQEWIGVDFDGTLAMWERWGGVLTLGEPIWPMVERVKGWLAAGKRVKIFTARMEPPYDPRWVTRLDVIDTIQAWTEKYLGERLEVTNVKDLHMIELWDDRAVQVEHNVGEPVTYWQSRVE